MKNKKTKEIYPQGYVSHLTPARVYTFPTTKKNSAVPSVSCCKVRMLEDDYTRGF